MMNKFEDREKTFEKKFANDQEVQFKVNARRNKYLGEWAALKLGKSGEEVEIYIQEVIKSDFQEPGDEDVFKKLKTDFESAKISIEDNVIKDQMHKMHILAKKDFF